MNWLNEKIVGWILKRYKDEILAWIENRGLHIPKRIKEQWASKYNVSVEFIEAMENFVVGKLIERLNKILGS